MGLACRLRADLVAGGVKEQHTAASADGQSGSVGRVCGHHHLFACLECSLLCQTVSTQSVDVHRVVLRWQSRKAHCCEVTTPGPAHSPSHRQPPPAEWGEWPLPVAGSSLPASPLSLCRAPAPPALAHSKRNNMTVTARHCPALLTSVRVETTTVPSEATHIPVGSSPDRATPPSLGEQEVYGHMD